MKLLLLGRAGEGLSTSLLCEVVMVIAINNCISVVPAKAVGHYKTALE